MKDSQDSFIAKALKVHGSTYDYSLVQYITSIKKVKIICKIHGEFFQRPGKHLTGAGCKECATKKTAIERFQKSVLNKYQNLYEYDWSTYKDCSTKMKIKCKEHGEFQQTPTSHLKFGCFYCGRGTLSVSQFIQKSNSIHNNIYNYSLVTKFETHKTKIDVICNTHGKFKTTVQAHLFGNGCKKCHNDKMKLNVSDLIKRFNKIHQNRYIYNITDDSYKNTGTKIEIQCSLHGLFYMSSCNHLSGKGCPECAKIRMSNNMTSDESEYLSKVKKIHHNLYDYSNTIYNGTKNNIDIICKTHGLFKQNAGAHLYGKAGCPKCAGNEKLDIDEFINRSNTIHNNKYDYSKTVYISYSKYVTITCPIHGDFNQSPYVHMNSNGCQKCSFFGNSNNTTAFLYIQKFNNNNYKIGITRNLKRRLTTINKKSIYEHVYYKIFSGDGNIIANVESCIKQSIPTGIISKDFMKDGYTETFDEVYLDSVLQIISVFNLNNETYE